MNKKGYVPLLINTLDTIENGWKYIAFVGYVSLGPGCLGMGAREV